MCVDERSGIGQEWGGVLDHGRGGGLPWRLALLPLLVLLLVVGGCSRDSLQAHRQRAAQYEKAGRIRAAIIELKNVLRRRPNDAATRYHLGRLYLRIGKGAAAEESFRRAGRLGMPQWQLAEGLGMAYGLQGKYTRLLQEIQAVDPQPATTKARIQILRGHARLATGASDKAFEEYEAALRYRPGWVDALVGMASVDMKRGRFASARRYLEQARQGGQKDPTYWLALGELEYRQHHSDKAERAFRRGLSLVGRNGHDVRTLRLRSGLVLALLKQGRMQAADEVLQRLIRQAPHHPVTLYLQAVMDYKRGRFTDASQRLQTVLAKSPANRSTLLLLGASSFRGGNLEQADRYLSRLLTEDPDNRYVRELLAITQGRLGQADAVIDTLSPVVAAGKADVRALVMLGAAAFQKGDYATSIRYLEQARRKAPAKTLLYRFLATAYLYAGQPKAALRTVAEEEARVKNTAPAADAQGTFRRTLVRVLARLQLHQPQAALDVARRLRRGQVDSPEAANLVATVELATGKRKAAERDYRALIEAHPDYLPARFGLARLALTRKDLDLARTQFQAILDHAPAETRAMLGMASVALAGGDTAGVEHWLERAVTARPKDAGLRLIEARYRLGRKQLDQALAAVNAALAVAPRRVDALNLLAVIQTARKDYGAAETALIKAVALRPSSVALEYNLARVRLRMGDREGAEGAVDRALSIAPGHLQANLLKIQLDVARKDWEDALGRARRLQRAYPKSDTGWILEANLLALQGHWQAAYHAMQTAYARVPKPRNLVRLARYAERASAGKGRALLEHWLQGHPDDLGIRAALAQVEEQAGRTEAALAAYQRILDRKSDDLMALNNAALLCARLHKDCATAYAGKALRLAPDNGAVLDTAGWILWQAGEKKKGRSLLARAAAALPANGDVLYHYAVALADGGAQDKAREVLHTALASDHPFTNRGRAEELATRLAGAGGQHTGTQKRAAH